LAVACFHFTNGGSLLRTDSWLRAAGSYGWLGTHVFFVVSGFVIPYSLFVSEYRLRHHLGRFLLKRIARIDPPYFVALAISIAAWQASTLVPGFRGMPFRLSVPQLLAHLGYVNAFLGYEWLNPVFWTLAIEFQYYVLCALSFPLLSSQSGLLRSVSLALWATAPLVHSNPALAFKYGGLFAMGILTFQFRARLWSAGQYYWLLTATFLLTGFTTGFLIAFVALATAAAIALTSSQRRFWFASIGTISYSLYLLHVPIGGRIVNLGARFAQGLPSQMLVLFTATIASLGSAYLMYVSIERPVQRWAASFKYPQPTSDPVPSVGPVVGGPVLRIPSGLRW